MPAQTTVLNVSMAPPPPAWQGDLTALFGLIAGNLRVTNPLGYNSFSTGAVPPTSDSGPWLKDGREWWVWDNTGAAYVPQRTTATLPINVTLPTGSTESALAVTPDAVAGPQVHAYVGGAWQSPYNYPFYGTTAQRPTSPRPYQRYLDTTLGCEIHFVPGAGNGWSTVTGCIGDVKFVTAATEAAALAANPGWVVYTQVRGHVLAGAFGELNGQTAHTPGQAVGEESHAITVSELPAHRHYVASNDSADGVTSVALAFTNSVVTTYNTGGTNDQDYTLRALNTTPEPSVGRTSSMGGSVAMSLMQPTYFLICLRKAF